MSLDLTNRLVGPTTISAQATYTAPLFVPAGANIDLIVAGSAGSVITLQKSVGPDIPSDGDFLDVAGTITYNKVFSQVEGVGSWYRAGIKTGNYVTNASLTLTRSEDGVANGQQFNAQTDDKGNVHTVNAFYTTVVSASKTRPNDTTTYASGEVVNESASAGTNWTFSNCARVAGGSGTIMKVHLDDSALQTLRFQGELWLFDAAPTADNDNAVFTPTDAEQQTVVAVIPLGIQYAGDATSGAGGNCLVTSGVVNEPFKCAAGSTTLYGVLVVREAYIPVAQEVFNIRLFIQQD